MRIFDKAKAILAETLSSPTKDSYVTVVDGKLVTLREGGNYRNMNLRGANLRGAHLAGINLEGADLTDAIVENAHFNGANLRGVRFRNADISGADFTGATLDTGERVIRGARAYSPPIGVIVVGGDNNGD
ncbi:pentapeptide repeat-containing protein [Pseudoalteromonas sp. DY56-GL79]|uniref:pentapeptide repeat-containing protein n=1 Tax=Pseudoalteromonas sp. DY56-GL79 TaxID=2967131 RepID=UPI003529F623